MRRPVIAVTLLLLFAACTPDLSAGPVPADDHSAATRALVARGMPAPERVWSGPDYAAAATLLETLVKEDASTLPRLGSAMSGAVFARMVDAENLVSAEAESLDLNQKMQLHLGILTGSSKLLGIYAAQSKPRATFDSELAALSGYVLATSDQLMVVTRAILKTIPADDPQREKRLAGFEKMRHGLGTIVSGCLTTLTEKHLYRPEARVQLAQTLAEHLPAIYGDLLPTVQQEIGARLATLVAQEQDAGLREAEKAIQASLAKGN